MRYLSVCSGIEAASVAWQPLGWTPAAFSEIEPFPCALLKHHYPDVPNLGDMTKFKEWPSRDELSIDLLCGGTPCQSFSVAGLRKGLDDPRGNLMLTYLAIADRYRPEWLVWENVPGVLSSNAGRDFGTFLGGLGQLEYGFAYRVLDAQFFGVPQRRRRVFVVGNLRGWQRAAAVLFERHSLSGHPAPRRETGQGFAAATAPSLTASGRGVERSGESQGQDPVVAVALRGRDGGGAIELGDDKAYALRASQGGGDKPHALVPDIVRQAMSAKWSKGTAGPAGDEHHNLIPVPAVTHSLRGEGHDASEDGTGRGTPLVAVIGDGLIAGAITAGYEFCYNDEKKLNHLVPVLPFDTTEITSLANRSNPQPGDACHPIAAGAHVPAIAIQAGATRENPDSGPDGIGVRTDGVAYTLEARAEVQAVQTAMQVRRLTPEECEALQGFPRSYTQVPNRNKPAADGPRYKALGNSWAVPCARWIGERIDAVDAITSNRKEAA